jgi:hypothetical protein
MVIKYLRGPSNILNGHKIYQHFLIYVRPSKIYPNWDFGFENKPSGNPRQEPIQESLQIFFRFRNIFFIFFGVFVKSGKWQQEEKNAEKENAFESAGLDSITCPDET